MSSLEEIVQQEINLGQKDPLTIARRIIELQDSGWLSSELLALSEDIISDIARQRLNSQRRSVVLRMSDSNFDESELRLKSLWIPDVGWTRLNDCTPEHIEARLAYQQKLASAVLHAVDWLETLLIAMRDAGAKTVSELGSLPPVARGELPG